MLIGRHCDRHGYRPFEQRRCRACERERDAIRRRVDPFRRITSTAAWQRARKAALARSGGVCELEHLSGCRGRIEVHHRTPLRRGGHPFDPSNLVVACRAHHEILEWHA